MATKPKAAAAATGPVPTEEVQPASQATPAPQMPARLTVPQAPKQFSGNSQQATGRIRDILQHALFQRQPTAAVFQVAADHVRMVDTQRAHPQVASYKAEALDFLRGKALALSN